MCRRSRRCGSLKSPGTIRIMLVLLHSHRLCNPSQIRRRPRNNRQPNNLRRLITVQPPYFLLQRQEFPPRRLHHQRKFRCRFNFPFPAVNGLHRCRRNVHARCEFPLHNRPPPAAPPLLPTRTSPTPLHLPSSHIPPVTRFSGLHCWLCLIREQASHDTIQASWLPARFILALRDGAASSPKISPSNVCALPLRLSPPTFADATKNLPFSSAMIRAFFPKNSPAPPPTSSKKRAARSFFAADPRPLPPLLSKFCAANSRAP